MERAGILHLGFLTRMKQSDRSEEHTSELQSPCNLVCRIIISEKHTSELQSPCNLVCRLLLEKNRSNSIGTRPTLSYRTVMSQPMPVSTREPLATPVPTKSQK